MKKVYFIIAVMIFVICGCAGMQGKPPGYVPEKIVSVPGLTKNQIFDQTKIYIAENFKSAKAVLEYENKETGTIIGNGVSKYPSDGIRGSSWTISYTMRVDIKDERYRCTFMNILLHWPSATIYGKTTSGGSRAVFYNDEFERISESLLSIPIAMKNSMQHSKSRDNW